MSESVKVAVRVRPFNTREIERNSVLVIKMENNSTYINNPESPDEEPKSFTFDYSYWSHDGSQEQPDGYLTPISDAYADQKVVFKDLGEGVLENAWNGYNCSLFAYGQTGSGKSYSMVGYGANKGIVPISCERLFQQIDEKSGSGWEYQVSLSMMEIYNEQARDLLNPATMKIKGGMKVRQHPKLGFYVDGLASVPVGSYNDIDQKIADGTKSRTVASTQMNATSSRAHTIVAINFQQKGTNEQTKQKVTKTSIINLVDLAGSERADSTGATGDTLKEGSAINQSLSCLGNVIKALADASTGGKKIVVPFRDSVLTKLLKNALGGNSKTVMIAALSPADINYEETLSTLRFADRAKAIKTKAVVNESPTEKLIRELREENAALMAKLKAAMGDPEAMAKLLAGEGGGGDEDSEDTKTFDEKEVEKMKREMEEEVKRKEEEMERMKQTWQERLKEQAEISKIKETELRDENALKKTTAHLWNLNEDSLLTNMVTHFLRPGSHSIGSKKADPPAEITLTGLSIQKQHAQIDHDGENDSICISPCDAKAKVMVNGMQISDQKTLHHGDRLLFGTNHLFVLHHPKDANLLQLQEQAQKEGKVLEDTAMSYEKAQEEIAKNSGLLGSRVFNFDNSDVGSKEFQMDMLLREDLLQVLPNVGEANAMSEEMDKKVIFEPILISPQARGLQEGRTEVNVKLRDLVTGYEWVWDKDKFNDRKYLMQEMYNDFTEAEEQHPEDVPEEKDPFWEPPDAEVKIGTVHIFLQSLSFKIDVSESLSITDYKGSCLGKLDCEIVPCTSDGKKLSDDDFVEDPMELIGTDLFFKLKIKAAKSLPDQFSQGEVYCKFSMYNEETATTTSKVQNTINPEFKFEKLYSFTPVEELFVEYLLNSSLVVEVWGKHCIEKSIAENVKLNNRRMTISTRQLITEDRMFNPRYSSSSSGYSSSSISEASPFSEEERYKLLCDVNVYKRRSERMEKKLKRIREMCDKRNASDKSSIKVKEVEKALYGPDKVDMQRFHAAADVVLNVNKVPTTINENDGSGSNGSQACVIS